MTPFTTLLIASLVLLAAGCASQQAPPARTFAPADGAIAARAAAAWDEALRRADSLPPSRILYDAKFGKGVVMAPGNLAVVARRGSLTAKATGPLGGELGSYEDGTFTGMGGQAYFLDAELLRGVLSGVWRGGAPAFAAVDGQESLLRWQDERGIAEGILDVPGARLKSLRIQSPKSEIFVEFSGAVDPWPEVIVLRDLSNGRSLKLRKVAVEALKDEF